mgnify:CR=1 FL=1
MNIKFIDDMTFDIIIRDLNIDYTDKEYLEEYLKKIFKRLYDYYDISIEGFYNITLYVDKYYGIIFHLEKENLEYYEYFKNQVDMRIIINETEFLYKVENLIDEINDKVDIIVNDNIYLKLKEKLTDREMMILCENSEVVYK